MLSVLYTNDMEPITVIDLPIEVHSFEFDRSVYKVPVFGKPKTEYSYINQHYEYEAFFIVEIHVEKFVRNGKTHPMFIVHESYEELALRLQPAYMAGQLSDLRNKEADSFWKGVATGLAAQLGG